MYQLQIVKIIGIFV